MSEQRYILILISKHILLSSDNDPHGVTQLPRSFSGDNTVLFLELSRTHTLRHPPVHGVTQTVFQG